MPDTVEVKASAVGVSYASAKATLIMMPTYERLQSMSVDDLIEQYNLCQELKTRNHVSGDFAGFWLGEISRRHQDNESERMLKITYITLAISVIATVAAVISIFQAG